ncbi:MAG: cysteine--tRNA ligase [Candidatus Altiarchaeota archaeon]
MAIRVYNTLSRRLEEFKPLKEGHVGVYVCGLTVYDYMHIGHARTYLAFDVILRYLKYRGYSVRYVQNVTDIDDKIIKRAKERDVSPIELSKEYAEKSFEDQEKLGLLKADAYPRVSENISEIIKAIQTLLEKGYAYVVDGSVYFDVLTLRDYGKLSNQDKEQLKKHRIEPDSRKKSPLDFALWKSSQKDSLGFNSPWGFGRPGWHIECSVMSRNHLGRQFDIHGGALDLIFPHHENEIAQSESLNGGKPFVRYWLHTGFLYSSGEKMSKSLGNIVSVREFLKDHSPESLRLFIMQTHYRSPIDYSVEQILSAEKAVERLRMFRRDVKLAMARAGDKGGHLAGEASDELLKKFIECMDDDFDTPGSVAAIFDAVRKINQLLSEGSESASSLNHSLSVFDELLSVLGLKLSEETDNLSPEEKGLVAERNSHRARKNWTEADRIRSILLKRGIRLLDKKDGSTLVVRD